MAWTDLVEFSCLKLGFGQRKCAVFHDVTHLRFGGHDLLQDLSEPHLQGVSFLLQEAVALLGSLETTFHQGLGTPRGKNVNSVLPGHVGDSLQLGPDLVDPFEGWLATMFRFVFNSSRNILLSIHLSCHMTYFRAIEL